MNEGLRVVPVLGLPEVREGDDLAALIAGAVALEDGDVLVVAQKAVSNAEGRVVEMHYAGLIPEVDAWKGLVAPVRATVRRYIDDTRLTPSAIYRRRLTAAEYRQVTRTVEYLHATERRWHAIFQNCNDFGIQIAEALGLWRPPSLMPPSAWVAGLRALNER